MATAARKKPYMRINVSVTVEITLQQMKDLVEYARICGHDYDNLNDARKIIKRLLIDEVEQTVFYAHERLRKS